MGGPGTAERRESAPLRGRLDPIDEVPCRIPSSDRLAPSWLPELNLTPDHLGPIGRGMRPAGRRWVSLGRTVETVIPSHPRAIRANGLAAPKALPQPSGRLVGVAKCPQHDEETEREDAHQGQRAGGEYAEPHHTVRRAASTIRSACNTAARAKSGFFSPRT